MFDLDSLRSLTLALAVTACMAVPACGAGQQEPMMFPDAGCWGVVSHTPFHGDAEKQIGVQWVRLNLRWNNIEKGERGSYDWADADKLLGYYLDRGFKVMGILTMEDLCPLYAADKDNKQVVIDACAKWCGAAAARYKGKGILWELGNEPEVFPMGGYWNNPETYTEMARKAAKAVKAADRRAKVAALSVAWYDPGFITRSLEAGLLGDGTIDVLTYHAYHRRELMPEGGLAEDITSLRDLIKKYAPAWKRVIVADSERGYAIKPFGEPKVWHSWRNQVYTESEQEAYLARHYLEEISLGVEIAVWYKDMNGEDAFSLYYSDEKDPHGLRPMGYVYRNLAALLPENPKKLRNDRYAVSPVGLPADSKVQVRTYLRRGKDSDRLVIALWNPVEAFDGKILDKRERVGDYYHETWRPIASTDHVDIPMSVRVGGLKTSQVKQMALYDLTAKTTESAARPVRQKANGGTVTSPQVKVGPMPTVIVLDVAK